MRERKLIGTRYLLAGIAVWALAGCANPTAMEEAVNRCAAVGISARDPDFMVCTEAYRLENQQAEIGNAYRNATDNMIPRRRRGLE